MENKFTILLVDDEIDFLDPIAFWLESKGYAVKVASNGKEAVDSIQKEVPDIVFLDMNMPVMDGTTALHKIREIHPDLPVIMITGVPEKVPRLDEMRISGYFPKKGTLEELEQLLEPLLRIHKKMRPAR
jgi:CheY-like chemotaxis protein